LRPSRIVRSESFRLTALFAALFLCLAGLLIGTVLWIVDDMQMATLTSANDADIASIDSGFRTEGVSEAVEVARQLLGLPRRADGRPPLSYILIEDDRQGKLAGNLAAGDRTAKNAGAGIVGRGTYIAPGIYVFVGRDTASIDLTRVRIVKAFAWVAGGAVGLAVIGGIFFGTQFMRRVDAITRTCEAIMAGRFHERIPVRASGNEWDRLARVINDMLNRISTLLDNLRQVSSDVAHDLRTPLTRLRRRLEEARDKSVTTADYDVAVARAIEDTDQLLVIFSALLRISQIESGSRLASFAPLSLTGLLENVCQMYRPVAEDHFHVLSVDIEKNVEIRGDAELLTQMFSNLIENSIRHTPARSHIRVSLTVRDGRIVAAVGDDGPGIPVHEHEKVLRRFYRLSDSRSDGGHGLGLALVAAIATLHKAKLTLADTVPGLRVAIEF
jgi:signal transduction histidine kinase